MRKEVNSIMKLYRVITMSREDIEKTLSIISEQHDIVYVQNGNDKVDVYCDSIKITSVLNYKMTRFELLNVTMALQAHTKKLMYIDKQGECVKLNNW